MSATDRQAAGAEPAGQTTAPGEELRPITGGAVMSGVSRTTVAVTGAAATIFVARLLGPSGAGGYTLALSFLALLIVATTLGVEHGIAYFVSSRRWSAARAYATSQRVAAVAGLTGAALGMLARVLVPSAFANLSVAMTAVVAFALPFALSWFYFTYIALAESHYEAYALPPAVQSAVALVLILILGAIYGLAGAVCGFALAHLLTAALAAAAARRILPASPAEEHGPGDEGSQLRRAISFGIKGYATNALQFVNLRIDLFVLATVVASADVGHYSVAVAVTSVMWLLPQALSDVLFPRVAALHARGGETGEDSLAWVEAKSLRHTVLIVLVTAVALLPAILLLIVPVYGPGFHASIDLALILLPGVALLAICATMSAAVIGRGHPGYMLVCALVVTPLTIVLYLLLIPTLKASGAALASTLSYAATFLLTAFLYRRATGGPLLARLRPTRSELADYRALAPAIREWAGNLRGRGAGASS